MQPTRSESFLAKDALVETPIIAQGASTSASSNTRHSSSNNPSLRVLERDGRDVHNEDYANTNDDKEGRNNCNCLEINQGGQVGFENNTQGGQVVFENNKKEPVGVDDDDDNDDDVASPCSSGACEKKNPLDDKLVTLVFGVDKNTRSETLARKFAQVSLLVADMLEFTEEEEDKETIILNLPNVPLNAVDPIIDYMKYEVFLKVDEQTPLDINSDYLNVEVPIEAQGELREEDKEFLSRWNNSHILEATVAAANYLNMKRLLDLVLFGVARWMYERRENISTIIHTDFSGFPDNVPDKEEKRKLVETFKKYARPSPTIC